MRRGAVLAAVVVAGFALGATVVLALSSTPDLEPEASERPADVSQDTEAEEAAAGEPVPLAKATPAPEPAERLLLAWTSGGLPEGFADDVADLAPVERVTVVAGGLVELTGSWDAEGQPVELLDDGWVIPLDAVAIDPGTYAAFVPKSTLPAISEMGDRTVLLSETGAQLRGLGEGARLAVAAGPDLTVAGVVDDATIAGAELALAATAATDAEVATPRYALIAYRGDRAEVEQAIRGLLPDGPPMRLRGPGESPVLRHGDAVLTQAQIKERFGEFSYRRTSGRDIEQDPAWVADNITTADMPVLGAVRCHRGIVPALEGALSELVREHLEHTLDPAGYEGCHVPRLTTSQEAVSRHAWGIAFDVNTADNPVGSESAQDPRLVEVLERWGFTWGGPWLVPDPAHFEFLRQPQAGLAPDADTD